MNRTIRGLLSIFIAVLLSMISWTAAGQEPSLTLSEAIQSTLGNDLRLKVAKLNLANAEIAYQRAQANLLPTGSKIDELQADLNWQQSQANFEEARIQLLLDIVSQYLQLKDLQDRVPGLQQKLELAQEELAQVQSKVAIGSAGKLDELQAEINLKNAVNSLESARNDLEDLKRSFSKATGIEARELEARRFVTDLPVVTLDKSLSEYLELALLNREELKFARMQIGIDNLELQRMRTENAPPLDINRGKNDVELSRINLTIEEDEIRDEVIGSYQSVKSLERNVALRQLQMEEAQEDYQNTEKQFDAGLKTQSDLLSKEVDFETAKLDYQKAVGDYYLAYQRLLNSADLELDLGGIDEQEG
ncbi:MAG: TolC family protein [Candidatus Bipolaricaulia bacterium]